MLREKWRPEASVCTGSAMARRWLDSGSAVDAARSLSPTEIRLAQIQITVRSSHVSRGMA